MILFTSPDRPTNLSLCSVFLAGSISEGSAEMWQDRVIDMLKDEEVIVLNPRRADWDSTWEQKIDNPQFLHQVLWELNGLKSADRIIFYFDPNTKAPITLLELGLIGGQFPEKCIVVCNEPFYRKGNVDIVCEEYGIKQVETLEKAVEEFKCYANSNAG